MKIAKQREWDVKVSAAPRIPRGNIGYPESLRIILDNVIKGTSYNEKIIISGSNADNDLEKLLIRIRPLGIVKKINNKWEVSDEAKQWIDSKDNKFLTTLINGNLKFFIEILYFCDGKDRSIKEIIEFAKSEYDLEWKGKSQLLDRLQWLRDLGTIILLPHKNTYKTTEIGGEIIKIVPISKVNETIDKPPVIDFILSDFSRKIIIKDQNLLSQRKLSTGYIPGGHNNPVDSIYEGLELINTTKSEELIYKYYESSYGIKKTSTRGFIQHLSNLKLIERSTLSSFELTLVGKELLESKNIFDLIIYYNNNYKFIIELLIELKEPRTRQQLIDIATLSYGITANTSSNISHRINIFESAGLVYFYKNKFHLNKGVEKLFSYFEPEIPIKIGRDDDDIKQNEHFEILNELNRASRDSMHPINFEKAITNIFLSMGFDTNLIGGSGNTDVLLKSPGSAQYSYSVCVDAKSTYSGPVTDSMVDFDTLKEHKKKHKADYIVIVGNSFGEGSRLVKRAFEHKVGLLDIQLLSHLYKQHMEVPISFDEYINIFNQCGIVDISVLEGKRVEMKETADLMLSIMEAFIKNKDELLTSRDLYWILNVNKTETSKFSKIEIENMLLFLSSPFIGVIEKKKEEYRALGSSQDLKQKFKFYMNNI